MATQVAGDTKAAGYSAGGATEIGRSFLARRLKNSYFLGGGRQHPTNPPAVKRTWILPDESVALVSH